MNWTTYDGTPETLPPTGKIVLVTTECISGCGYLLHKEGRDGDLRIGDSWLPIPTQEQCEAPKVASDTREAELQVIEACRRVDAVSGGEIYTAEAFAQEVVPALAKLDALKAQA